MRHEERNKLNTERTLYFKCLRLKNGFINLFKDKKKSTVMILYLIIMAIIIYIYNDKPLYYPSPVQLITYHLYYLLLILSAVVGLIALVYVMGAPITSWKMNRQLKRIGLVNKAGEGPYLMNIYDSENYYTMEFVVLGIPVEAWEDKSAEIEAALNIHVVNLKQGKSRNYVLVDAVDFEDALPSYIPWEDKYISEKEFELALGKSVTGIETVNLDNTPHALIAGSTGSGKTIMLKCLMYQCLKKSAQVTLIDFKGGANFTKIWKEHLDIIKNEQELNPYLDKVLFTLKERMMILDEADCENITQYNQRYSATHLSRIIIAFDEVAECLDKSGLSIADKKIVMELEHKISTIARLGRAFGIHLILGLQRPDANVLSGQVKSNIDLRICGRSDDVLSQIALDNTDASRKINKDERGRFVLGNGDLIQGFYFTDADMK